MALSVIQVGCQVEYSKDNLHLWVAARTGFAQPLENPCIVLCGLNGFVEFA